MGDIAANETGPILLATDFSDDSEAAYDWAVQAARRFGASLHVLHVVHDSLDAPGTYVTEPGSSLEKLEDVARDMLDRWLERVSARDPAAEAIEIGSSIAVGLPETRILEVAAAEGARLIVMGGRGQTGLTEVILGSRAEQVAGNSLVPVTIVRSPPSAAGKSTSPEDENEKQSRA